MTMDNKINQHILIVQQEWKSWSVAKYMSYTTHAFAFEEGLKKLGVDCFILTTPWLSRSEKILRKMSFDQVWIIDVVHLEIEEKCLKNILRLAPIRVGFVMESLEYLPEEYESFPNLKDRKKMVLELLKKYTHAIMVDEKDVIAINESSTLSAMWLPVPIPRRFIVNESNLKPVKPAVFCGSVYGLRKKWLKDQNLKPFLTIQKSLDDETLYPFFFNGLHYLTNVYLMNRLPCEKFIHSIYNSLLRIIRQKCFILLLRSMQSGCAVINLPSIFKGYAGRVVEGMAAGCPVISWYIPDRPQTERLFKDNSEILLYETNDPNNLTKQIRRIQTEVGLASSIIEKSRHKIIKNHTIEKRTQQILQWVKNGDIPSYD